MPLNCWDCGEQGHVATACPNKDYIKGTGSDWCGTCDERTRLVSLNEEQTRMQRCGTCHPKRGQLAQHRTCPSCRVVVYEWDIFPCDKHQVVGRQYEHIDVARRDPEPRDHRMLALEQVEEARRARLVT